MFIELTERHTNKRIILINALFLIENEDGSMKIQHENGDTNVNESYEEIIMLIEQAQAKQQVVTQTQNCKQLNMEK